MKKERETANKYRQQALEGDLMAIPTFWGMFLQSFLIFHTIHFGHKKHKSLIINGKSF